MRKYALVNNSIVNNIIDTEEDQYELYIKQNQQVIDITDTSPLPQIGWILQGNSLKFPDGTTDREKMEIELNEKKRKFGTNLCNISIDKIGARNKILNKNGAQVTSLLTQLIGIKALLETGALGTARYSCSQLKFIFTEYSDIFDYIINEINVFEATNGL